MLKAILHASLIVQDLQTSLDFYCGVLGLSLDENRPDLPYPGAWLKVGEQQIHLLNLPNPDPVEGRPAHGGRDRHIAFAIDDLQVLKQKLQASRIPYTESKSGRLALFCRDPDGNALEFIQ